MQQVPTSQSVRLEPVAMRSGISRAEQTYEVVQIGSMTPAVGRERRVDIFVAGKRGESSRVGSLKIDANGALVPGQQIVARPGATLFLRADRAGEIVTAPKRTPESLFGQQEAARKVQLPAKGLPTQTSGNCWLVSAVQSTWVSNRAALETLPDGSPRVVRKGNMSAVTLYDYDPQADRFSPACYLVPYEEGESWGDAVEKAMTARRGGGASPDATLYSGWPEHAYEALFGVRSTSLGLRSLDLNQLKARILEAWREGRPMSLSSNLREHVEPVLDVEVDSRGQVFVSVGETYGRLQERTRLSLQELKRGADFDAFDLLHIGNPAR